jgi:hypothetical protein
VRRGWAPDAAAEGAQVFAMSVPGEAVREVERAGARQAERGWVKVLARAGYLAKACVYAVIGGLALRLALGEGGRTTDSRGAIATLSRAPLGKALVLLLAVGLAGMALWMIVEAIGDPERTRRSGFLAAASRIGQAIAGLGYVALAIAAVRVSFGGDAGRGGDAEAQSWTARALQLPAGRWLVLAGAAIVVIVGVRQIRSGVRRKFLEKLDLAAMGARLRRWTDRLGVAGLSAQGVVFVLVGLFFAAAALRQDPSEATGFDGALAAISRQPSGMALLGAVAVGLLAFAAFSAIEGRHRRLGRR